VFVDELATAKRDRPNEGLGWPLSRRSVYHVTVISCESDARTKGQ
jgi:hypothetical protein